MTGIVSGEVDDPLFAGEVYCSMIEACQWIGDWGRAAQWTRALTTWCNQETGLVAFTGQCAVHRAQLMRFNGAFDDAVIELERAVERYEAVGNRAAMALVYTERGDVLRLMGDLEGADQAYAAAVLHGSDAQLGRALVSLSRGDIDRAVSAVRSSPSSRSGDIFRHRIIPRASKSCWQQAEPKKQRRSQMSWPASLQTMAVWPWGRGKCRCCPSWPCAG